VSLEEAASMLEERGFIVRRYSASYVSVYGLAVKREDRIIAVSTDSRIRVIVKRAHGSEGLTLVLRLEGLRGAGRLMRELESRGGYVDAVEDRLLAVFKHANGPLLGELVDAILGARRT